MLTTALTLKELKTLGVFLGKGKDKGWLGLTELHAFLSALISGPNLIPPSEWHPYAFGDEGLEFESEDQAQDILMLLMRLNNHIVNQLTGRIPSDPIVYRNGILLDYQVSDDQLAKWCASYLEGAHFDDTWYEQPTAVGLLIPLAVLSNDFNLIGEKVSDGHVIDDGADQRQSFKENLPMHLIDLYDFWLARRTLQPGLNYPENEAAITTYEPTSKKIGRNDPCLCGSGKKYKKCCLNSETITYH